MSTEQKTVLITSGFDFIGSHTFLSPLQYGYRIISLDNYSNSTPRRLHSVAQKKQRNRELDHSRGRYFKRIRRRKGIHTRQIKIRLKPYRFSIHNAGLKSEGNSISVPIHYWEENFAGSINLFRWMRAHQCFTMVFSCSVTFYGIPDEIPIAEDATISPINPYGQTKAAIERILLNIFNSENEWWIAPLRYFNPVWSHPSGVITEDPLSIPTNLCSVILRAFSDKLNIMCVFGGNWPTHDGSAISDYIHAKDLAEGHCAALNNLLNKKMQVFEVNLGREKDYIVIETIREFEWSANAGIRYEIVDRRPGDAAISVAPVDFGRQKPGWTASRKLTEMCRDALY